MGYFDRYAEEHLPPMESHPIAKLSEIEAKPLTIKGIRFKEKMVTTFGVKDMYILDVEVEGEMRTVFCSQTVLASKLRWMMSHPGWDGLVFEFVQRRAQEGTNHYWDLLQVDQSA